MKSNTINYSDFKKFKKSEYFKTDHEFWKLECCVQKFKNICVLGSVMVITHIAKCVTTNYSSLSQKMTMSTKLIVRKSQNVYKKEMFKLNVLDVIAGCHNNDKLFILFSV